MITLINWTARRAGGRITINGVNQETGQPLKVVGVDVIKPEMMDGGIVRVIATHHSGERIKLDVR